VVVIPRPQLHDEGLPTSAHPDWVTHDEGTHGLNGFDDTLPEFDPMRREGILFIYKGKPSCFKPPENVDG
jgi:hypothetical protein